MLGEKLKQLRKNTGLTQEEIANKLNMSRGTYAHYELDRREPNYETVAQLANFFNVSIDYLFGRTNADNNKIINSVSDDPELEAFTRELMERESMQLLFKQVKPMADSDISKILKIIKAIEDDEDKDNGITKE